MGARAGQDVEVKRKFVAGICNQLKIPQVAQPGACSLLSILFHYTDILYILSSYLSH
jgi:hypothetical protein